MNIFLSLYESWLFLALKIMDAPLDTPFSIRIMFDEMFNFLGTSV